MTQAHALVPGETPATGQVPRLSYEICRSLLAGTSSGYLALSQSALPFVVPVSCVLDGDALVVRAGLGLLGGAPLQPGVVAFETDGGNLEGTSRWEVLVQGHCELTAGSATPKIPPHFAFVGAHLTTVLRVRMELVTGWRYGTAVLP